jgi:hypothetical protein
VVPSGNARLLSEVFAKIALATYARRFRPSLPLREAGDIRHVIGHRQPVGR